jgi:hypothetical protein
MSNVYATGMARSIFTFFSFLRSLNLFYLANLRTLRAIGKPTKNM